MQIFQRKSLVQSFRLPLWGHVADETPPHWVVSRLQAGEIEMNSLGGFTMATDWGVQSCAAGDIILLFADDSIGFEKPERFERDFAPVTADQLLRAA